MKKKIIYFAIATYIAQSDLSFSSERNLRQSYVDLYESTLGGKMEISCMGSVYKIEKGVFSGLKIYFKDELQWVELDKSDFKPAGFSFKGLASNAVADKDEISAEINLPIFVATGLYQIPNKPIDYFVVSKNNIFVPFKYSVDVYSGEIIGSNEEDVITRLELDSKKYRNEQGRGVLPRLHGHI